eukprot:scaffold94512_cov31-Tisochrysis_lutea.AAC.1
MSPSLLTSGFPPPTALHSSSITPTPCRHLQSFAPFLKTPLSCCHGSLIVAPKLIICPRAISPPTPVAIGSFRRGKRSCNHSSSTAQACCITSRPIQTNSLNTTYEAVFRSLPLPWRVCTVCGGSVKVTKALTPRARRAE